jgi:hypothetical protein
MGDIDTDKMIDVTPANIKENVKIGCKCQMALEVKGWTYRLRKEDKAKGVGEAVIVRLKLAPIVIGISAPPAPTKPWDYSFSKLESKSKAHQIAEAQTSAQAEPENDSAPVDEQKEPENRGMVHELSEDEDHDEQKGSEDDDGKHFSFASQYIHQAETPIYRFRRFRRFQSEESQIG